MFDKVMAELEQLFPDIITVSPELPDLVNEVTTVHDKITVAVFSYSHELFSVINRTIEVLRIVLRDDTVVVTNFLLKPVDTFSYAQPIYFINNLTVQVLSTSNIQIVWTGSTIVINPIE